MLLRIFLPPGMPSHVSVAHASVGRCLNEQETNTPIGMFASCLNLVRHTSCGRAVSSKGLGVGDHALLLDAGSLTGELTQIVKLSATHLTVLVDLDGVDAR